MKKNIIKVCIAIACFAFLHTAYAADNARATEYFGERLNRFERGYSWMQCKKLEDVYLNAQSLYKNEEWADAVKAFDEVAHLQVIPFAYRAQAYALTAKMYYFGNNRLERDYVLALKFCNAFLRCDGDFFEQDFVTVSLHAGQIHLKGQSGKIERDFTRARKHLMDVVFNLYALPQDQMSACLGLGILYYNGDDNIKKDYALAKEYFNRVLDKDSKALTVDTATARMFMKRIHEIEKQQASATQRRLTI